MRQQIDKENDVSIAESSTYTFLGKGSKKIMIFLVVFYY